MIGTAEAFQAWAAARGFDADVIDEEDLDVALSVSAARLANQCNRNLEKVEGATHIFRLAVASERLLLPVDFLGITTVTVLTTELGADAYRPTPGIDPPIVLLLRLDGGCWPSKQDITVVGDTGYTDPLPADLVDVAYVMTAEGLFGEQMGEVQAVSIQGIRVQMADPEARRSALNRVIIPHVKLG